MGALGPKVRGASNNPVTFTLFDFIVVIVKVVDMRWGVRDEMTNEHMTTGI